jgi:5'-nucleotidase
MVHSSWFIVHGSWFRARTLLLAAVFIAAGLTVSSAKEITILYTGDTHAMIYPCNCPIEPDGGVARRAALIKQIKKGLPQALLLDAGGFFAGGIMDEYSQNVELDKKRTLANIRAVELMQYDAIAVGDDEFNFGAEFFRKNLDGRNMHLLSCNTKGAQLLPYLIKEVSGIKIGVIGAVTITAASKAGELKFSPVVPEVKKAMEEVRKKGADITVVLGHLTEAEETSLLNEAQDMDIYISGGRRRAKEEAYTKAGSVLVLKPSWQGRRLGKLTLDIDEHGKIKNYSVDEPRLSSDIPDDPQVLSLLPGCFSDANCKKEGFVGECRNQGSKVSACVFSKANKVNLTVIVTKECLTCQSGSFVEFLKKVFPGLSVSYLYYPDKRSEQLIKDLNIQGLPAYLLGKEAKDDKKFENLKPNLIEIKDYYMVKPAFAGFGYLLNREKKKGLDLFISPFDKNSGELLPSLLDFNPSLHFLAIEREGKFEAQGGSPEVEEDLRALCVQKYYPERFSSYLTCRAKDINSSWWQDCASGMDEGKIRTCARGEEGKALLRVNIDLNRQLQVMFGPLVLVDNREIFGIQGTPDKKELEKVLKR